MLPEDTSKDVDSFLVKFSTAVRGEKEKTLDGEEKKKLREVMGKVLIKLEGERSIIQEYLSANYPFPEIREEGSES